jgi:hypothetical protein
MQGTKKFIANDSVASYSVPHLEGLHIEDLLA